MLTDKIKDLVKPKEETKGKKKIENLVVLVIILVITIIAINSIWNDDKKTTKESIETDSKKLSSNYEQPKLQDNTYNDKKLEQNLETILSSINGVGRVKVFINYSESSTIEAMYNETKKESSTEETDNSGGVRTIQQTDTQKDIIYSEESGAKEPVTQKIVNPTIEGAIITAEGAGDVNTKTNIINAVSAATGLQTHKIQVFKMNRTK